MGDPSSKLAPKSTERDSQIVPNQRQWMLSKGGTMLSLKTMTKSKLKVLKREIEAAIDAKITARRHEIESELSRLSLLDGSARIKVVRAAANRTDAARYWNSGSASKAVNRKPDESLIVDSTKVSPSAKQPKRTRKTKKARNAGDIAPAVLLTSAKTDHTEPVCIEPLSSVPIKALSGTSLYPNNIPGDLGASV
jgi:hypothetical protein